MKLRQPAHQSFIAKTDSNTFLLFFAIRPASDSAGSDAPDRVLSHELYCLSRLRTPRALAIAAPSIICYADSWLAVAGVEPMPL
jgi:hypothetical protein